MSEITICPAYFPLYPKDICHRLSIYIDLQEVSGNPPELLNGSNLFETILPKKFTTNDAPVFLAGNEQTESIFSAFFNQPEKLKLLYQKIKTIELLLYLGKTELISSRRLSGYKTEQICVVRKIHEQLNQYYDAWLQYNNVYEEWAKAHGLSVNCLLVLCAICDSGDGCTQKKISQQWLIPKQTINMVSKDLQRKGFVKLSPLPEDKRNKVIRFTKEGKEYADTIVNALRKAELSVIEEIGVEHMRQLNENMALFAKLFVKAGGINGNEAKP